MSFHRTIAFFIALGVVAINVAGGAYALYVGEGTHAFLHAAAAVAFGLIAGGLRLTSRSTARTAAGVDQPDRVDLLQSDLSDLERELRETQARLKFADELLKNRPADESRTQGGEGP